MAINSIQELFNQLLATSSPSEINNILSAIGDNSETELDKPFGKLNVFWHAYGDRLSNHSTIGLATKPGRSLTERITNAVDAIIDERALTAQSKPTSPFRAASEWFGRPVSGPDTGLFKWDYSDGSYDRKIAVILSESGEENFPTVDVVDFGSGIAHDQFPSTILSLQSGNKLTKRYLIGAYGQGGSSTLAFSDYALIISKHVQNPNIITFTVIKVMIPKNIDEFCYVYLATEDEQKNISALTFSVNETELNLYNHEKLKLSNLVHGTIIRHYGFKLTNLAGSLAPQAGNLYHFLQLSMFDPIIPFRVIDLRNPEKVNDQIIKGSRNRLMEYTVSAEQNENSRTELKHYRPMEYVVPVGSVEPCIGIEYWVIFNKQKEKKDADYTLRPESNILFIQRRYPIVGTLNGQNQGELSSQLLRSLNLGLVAKHIIIHIDATKAPILVRNGLFSTSREGFKEGPVLESIKAELERMLKEDFNLEIIEKELIEKITSKETETTNDEVNRQITKLLIEAGFASTTEGSSSTEGTGQTTVTKTKRKRPPIKLEPLPTLPFPQVTQFKIVTPQLKMEINLNDAEVVLVETDADAEFYKRSLIAIRFDPNILEVASVAPLRGGRIRWRVRPKEDAKAGVKGKIVVVITKLDGTQLSDEIEYEVFPAVEKPSKQDKGIIPPFKIIATNPDDPNWSNAWEDIDKTSDDVYKVAYIPRDIGGITHVYYNTEFTPFRAQADKIKTSSETALNLFETNYQIWIGYHAILQFKSQLAELSEDGVEAETNDEVLEQERENERARVATMQVKQAMKSTELMMKLSKFDAITV